MKKIIRLSSISLMLTALVLFSCSKEEEKTVNSSTNTSTGPNKVFFNKKLISTCPVNFIVSISSNNGTIIPSGVTPVGGCSSAVNLNLSTEVQYNFALGKTGTASQVYNGLVTFRESNGNINMIVQTISSPDGYSLTLLENCSAGTKDIVIQ